MQTSKHAKAEEKVNTLLKGIRQNLERLWWAKQEKKKREVKR